MNFKRLCTLLAARRCFNAGQPVSKIAKDAGVSKTTVRRWLKETF